MIVKHSSIVHLCSLINSDGEPYYAYVSVSLNRTEEFIRAISTGPIELSDFGHVLLTGAGAEPNAEIAALAQELWGYKFDQPIEVIQ